MSYQPKQTLHSNTKEYVIKKSKPKTIVQCSHCGAPVQKGETCSYCGFTAANEEITYKYTYYDNHQVIEEEVVK